MPDLSSGSHIGENICHLKRFKGAFYFMAGKEEEIKQRGR
jgi:hypothetical protein